MKGYSAKLSFCKAIIKKGSVCTNQSKCEGYCNLHDKKKKYAECIVCYEDAWNPVKLNCTHVICEDCFEQWYIDRENSTCPICRDDATILAEAHVCKINRIRAQYITMGNNLSLNLNSNNKAANNAFRRLAAIYEWILTKPSFLLRQPLLYDIIFSNLLHKNQGNLGIFRKSRKMLRAFNHKFGENSDMMPTRLNNGDRLISI